MLILIEVIQWSLMHNRACVTESISQIFEHHQMEWGLAI